MRYPNRASKILPNHEAFVMAKAIHDEVSRSVPDRVEEVLKPHLEEIKAEQGSQWQEMSRRLCELANNSREYFDSRLVEMKGLYETKARELNAAREKDVEELRIIMKSLSGGREGDSSWLPAVLEVTKTLEAKFNDRILSMTERYTSQLESMRKTYEGGIEVIKKLLEAIPQLIANISVSVPEGAINVQAPIVKNILPEQQPVVNVTIPDGAISIKTQVELPKKVTRTEKSIIYSQVTGRPEKVVEEVTEQ